MEPSNPDVFRSSQGVPPPTAPRWCMTGERLITSRSSWMPLGLSDNTLSSFNAGKFGSSLKPQASSLKPQARSQKPEAQSTKHKAQSPSCRRATVFDARLWLGPPVGRR